MHSGWGVILSSTPRLRINRATILLPFLLVFRTCYGAIFTFTFYLYFFRNQYSLDSLRLSETFVHVCQYARCNIPLAVSLHEHRYHTKRIIRFSLPASHWKLPLINWCLKMKVNYVFTHWRKTVLNFTVPATCSNVLRHAISCKYVIFHWVWKCFISPVVTGGTRAVHVSVELWKLSRTDRPIAAFVDTRILVPLHLCVTKCINSDGYVQTLSKWKFIIGRNLKIAFRTLVICASVIWLGEVLLSHS